LTEEKPMHPALSQLFQERIVRIHLFMLDAERRLQPFSLRIPSLSTETEEEREELEVKRKFMAWEN
jgi:hypothetical protein